MSGADENTLYLRNKSGKEVEKEGIVLLVHSDTVSGGVPEVADVEDKSHIVIPHSTGIVVGYGCLKQSTEVLTVSDGGVGKGYDVGGVVAIGATFEIIVVSRVGP